MAQNPKPHVETRFIASGRSRLQRRIISTKREVRAADTSPDFPHSTMIIIPNH
ncbi:hypothetical protein H6H01_06350 [Nostoc calcicola FACHB-3891]|nr:hypothetical protein [Nostoc calcicola FACHB-3891]